MQGRLPRPRVRGMCGGARVKQGDEQGRRIKQACELGVRRWGAIRPYHATGDRGASGSMCSVDGDRERGETGRIECINLHMRTQQGGDHLGRASPRGKMEGRHASMVVRRWVGPSPQERPRGAVRPRIESYAERRVPHVRPRLERRPAAPEQQLHYVRLALLGRHVQRSVPCRGWNVRTRAVG